MHSDDSHHGSFPVTFDLGHVPRLGNPLLPTTVNPVDLSLAQPSHGPTQSSWFPHDVVFPGYSSVGYPAVDHTSQGAPVWPLQSIGHTSGQGPVPTGHFTGHLTPVGQTPREPPICRWVLDDSSICGQMITKASLSKHLAEHGIQGMHRDRIVWCGWYGCWADMKRNSLTRHCREVHLGLKRRPRSHKCACRSDAGVL